MNIKSVFSHFLFLVICTFTVAVNADCTLHLNIEGGIGPAALDYLERGQKLADQKKCRSILLTINTPGGNLQTTRLIVENILNSKRPFLCLVSPSGGHAGSAGAIILQACHVAGAMAATNIGAATPVSGGGEQIADDMRKKMINDSKSWVQGLAKLRNRNLQFAEDIITKAEAVTAAKAEVIGAIDFKVESVQEFLDKSKDKEVALFEGATGKVAVADLESFRPGLRYEILQMATDPQFAYLMFMGSLGLLYFEITHPGMMVPGIIGGVGLVLSMVSFHKLNVDWAGVILILLGIALMIGEAFVPSFGALGIGGMASFVIGSLLLYDPARSGVFLPLEVVLVPAIVLGLITFFIARMAYRSFRERKRETADEYCGKEAIVVEIKENGLEGLVEVNGETWKFTAKSAKELQQKTKVVEQKGLTLVVE